MFGESLKEALRHFFRSQKFYLMTGISGVVGMVATSGLFVKGVKNIFANIKHKNWKGVLNGALQVIPMLGFAASVIISLVTGYRLYTGAITEASGTIARLSNLAVPAVATGGTKIEEMVDKTTDKIAETVYEEKPKQVISEADDIEFIDSISGRHFRSSVFKVKQALNDFNAKLVSSQDFMTVNDWYYYLGVDEVGIGDDLGFQIDANGNGLLRIDFQPKMVDGKPITYIVYRVKPKAENTRGY